MHYNGDTPTEKQEKMNKATMKNTLKLTVTKVEVRESNFGITNFKPAKYARIHHRQSGQCLYIEGVSEKGEKVHFFTPQAVVTSCDGMLHYQSLTKNVGNFFKEVKGETKGHQSCFEGDTVMPMVISDSTEIIPAINVQDSITISYSKQEIKFNSLRLKSTRLISIN